MTDLMTNIKKLRDITGAGFLDCKKALEANDNNIDSSIDFLRTKGLAKANKKSSREANEGAIGIYSNEKFTTIILINTETDFAAKNDVFLDFVDSIGLLSLGLNDMNISIDEFKQSIFQERTVDDRFKDIIAKIGENIILSKFYIIKKNTGTSISSYIHNPYRENIGKIAVVLNYDCENNNNESDKFGKNLCMHIAASKPIAMNIDLLDKEFVSKEREVQLETIKSSGKPDNIIEKILDGKMNKFFNESTFVNQSYILDPDKSVTNVIDDFSKNNKFEIIKYELLTIGS